MSDSLWPHGLRHTRLRCPSPSPRVCSNSCPLSQWCHPTISSSSRHPHPLLILISSCRPLLLMPSIFPSIRVFSNDSVLRSGSQSFGFHLQSFQWIFRVDFLQNWLVWSPCSPRDSQESSPTHSSKTSILWHSAFFMVQLSHPYMTAGKTITLITETFVGNMMSLLFNTLSSFVIAFRPRSRCPLISWLQNHGCKLVQSKTLNTHRPNCIPQAATGLLL